MFRCLERQDSDRDGTSEARDILYRTERILRKYCLRQGRANGHHPGVSADTDYVTKVDKLPVPCGGHHNSMKASTIGASASDQVGKNEQVLTRSYTYSPVSNSVTWADDDDFIFGGRYGSGSGRRGSSILLLII